MSYVPGPKAQVSLAQQGRCPVCASYETFYQVPRVPLDAVTDDKRRMMRECYCEDCQAIWDEYYTVCEVSRVSALGAEKNGVTG